MNKIKNLVNPENEQEFWWNKNKRTEVLFELKDI